VNHRRSTTRVVSFECEGFRLFGTLHEPSSLTRASDVAVLVLNQGPVDRSGAHRLSIQLAEKLVEAGFPVLRFDARGAGDSEGDWRVPDNGSPLHSLYALIELGAWAPDARAATDFLLKETTARRVILLGLCGGASTALFAGLHPAVAAVIAVGTPVRLQADIRGVGDLVDEGLDGEVRTYLKKLTSPGAWTRFVSGRTQYRLLGQILITRLKRAIGVGLRRPPRLNLPLVRCVERCCARGVRVWFVFAERDYLWTEFQALFLPRLAHAGLGLEVTVIPDADHTFSARPASERLTDAVRHFLVGEVRWDPPSGVPGHEPTGSPAENRGGSA
jgi:uncharacterized protein